jgi:hypothetical protein
MESSLRSSGWVRTVVVEVAEMEKEGDLVGLGERLRQLHEVQATVPVRVQRLPAMGERSLTVKRVTVS